MKLHEIGTEQGVLTNHEYSLTQVHLLTEFDCNIIIIITYRKLLGTGNVTIDRINVICDYFVFIYK